MAGDKPDEKDIKPNQEAQATAEKLKVSRARYAGWLTRSITQLEESTSIKQCPTVLGALRDRIASQHKKLQACHEAYVAVLSDDASLDEAEDWMERQFSRVVEAFKTIDVLLQQHHKVEVADSSVQPDTSALEKMRLCQRLRLTLSCQQPAMFHKTVTQNHTRWESKLPPKILRHVQLLKYTVKQKKKHHLRQDQ